MNQILSRECEKTNSYRLLSECYYPPDDKLMKMLNGLKESADGSYAEITRNMPGMNEIEPLRVDHARLFVGPYKALAPAYGSAYLEDSGQIMSDSTIDVMKWYRAEGLDIALKEPPDHIIVELEFMYFLASKGAEAINCFDSRTASCYLAKQKSFLDTHLGRWVSEFAANVDAHAKTEFYKSLARVTRSFIKNIADVHSGRPDPLEFVFFENPKKKSARMAVSPSDPECSGSLPLIATENGRDGSPLTRGRPEN